jgi:hypothetical protein
VNNIDCHDRGQSSHDYGQPYQDVLLSVACSQLLRVDPLKFVEVVV